MGCCGSKEEDGIVSQTANVATTAGGAVVGAAGAVVGGTVAVARGGVELVPGGRQLLEHVDDATGAFADATVKTGELVAAATVKVASEADFMRIISKPEVPPVPPVLLQQRQRHRELARPDSQVLLCHRPSCLLRLLRYKRSCPRSVCCAASAPPSCRRR